MQEIGINQIQETGIEVEITDHSLKVDKGMGKVQSTEEWAERDTYTDGHRSVDREMLDVFGCKKSYEKEGWKEHSRNGSNPCMQKWVDLYRWM